MRWYVIQAKDTDLAQQHLGNQGYNVHKPTIEVRGKKGVREMNMFGSYMFVQFDIETEGWQNIGYTRGVRRLMCMHDEEPSKVPIGFVEDLIKRGEEGHFKVKSIELIKVGETVKILEGPLEGVEGICSFSTGKRVGILLHLLGGETRVYLSNSSVARL